MCIGLRWKNQKKNHLVAVVLGLVLAAPVHADSLTFEASVAEAAGNNAALRSARSNLDAAGYNTSAAYSGYYPQVSLGAGSNVSVIRRRLGFGG